MIINKNPEPKSSFLSVEKDASLIFNMLMRNQRLRKMLYYTSKDCLDKPPVSDAEAANFFGKQIKIVPKLTIDNNIFSYIILSFDNFTQNFDNPQFRDNMVEFDIICHFDQWQLKDFQLRPYRIAAEIDSMFNNKHLTGIGKLEFFGASQMILTDEYAGLCLLYRAVHGGEDQKGMLNPEDEAQFEKDFKALMGY